MKSKGSQLRRQNIVQELEVVVVAISLPVVDALLLTVGKDLGSLRAAELLCSERHYSPAKECTVLSQRR